LRQVGAAIRQKLGKILRVERKVFRQVVRLVCGVSLLLKLVDFVSTEAGRGRADSAKNAEDQKQSGNHKTRELHGSPMPLPYYNLVILGRPKVGISRSRGRLNGFISTGSQQKSRAKRPQGLSGLSSAFHRMIAVGTATMVVA